MSIPSLQTLSLIMQTNEEVDQAAEPTRPDAVAEDGGSAFVQSPAGFTVELLPGAETDQEHR
ncbi:hypothetical protein [Microlunatus soli]|uniref:Uncharacterized protein n=1 Tax=Microlunatus soli TaxID=630515 RepID=A0A1H1ZWN6_9ACTN|nr:hypothetical protein [Microlunatus soli]SDT38073.1 hypothetical protein SAMN04489812_5505 [Microlunatus soli]